MNVIVLEKPTAAPPIQIRNPKNRAQRNEITPWSNAGARRCIGPRSYRPTLPAPRGRAARTGPKKIHRAGCAFVRLSRELSAFRLAASPYSPQERLRPTRAPCSVQEQTYAVGHASARGERRRKARSLRVGPGEILWISCELGVEPREQRRHVVESAG